VKDTIIVNGRNYYPQDLEQAASDVGDVRKGRVVAFGTGAGTGQDRIVIVLEPTDVPPAEDLADRVRGRILEAIGVRVDEVVVAPSGTIPKTTSGKLQRVRVRQLFEAGALLRKESPALCFACHDRKAYAETSRAHAPAKDGRQHGLHEQSPRYRARRRA